MQDVTPDTWLIWPVKLGWLTLHGDELIAYLGHYQRQRLVADGLLVKEGCPQLGQVTIISDVDECTRKTGEAFATRLALDCTITARVQVDASGPDLLFSLLKTGICRLNNANVTGAIPNRVGGLTADFTRHRRTASCESEQVLNFPQSNLCLNHEKQDRNCSLMQALPSEPEVNADNVSLTDAVSLASMLTKIFLLQQAQGMPEPRRKRITDSHQWNTLLGLRNAQFYSLQRTPEVTRNRVTPLLDLTMIALASYPLRKQAYGMILPASVLFIAGYDANLANLDGVLRFNRALLGQPDNTPPGGELVLEHWRQLSDNGQWIRVSPVFRVLQRIRDKTPLSLNTPSREVKLTLAGCEERDVQDMCSLVGFIQIVNEARIPMCALHRDK